MRHVARLVPVMVLMAFLGRPEVVSSEPSRGPRGLSPLVVGMDEVGKGKKQAKPSEPPRSPIEVDEKGRTVRVAVTFVRSNGAVELPPFAMDGRSRVLVAVVMFSGSLQVPVTERRL